MEAEPAESEAGWPVPNPNPSLGLSAPAEGGRGNGRRAASRADGGALPGRVL
jgi:hypothetical protein